MNVIEIVKELANIDGMVFTIPSFMQVDELLIGCTDIYSNTVAVYEDNNANIYHIIFSRDHRCVGHYIVNEELHTIVLNEDETTFAKWTSMTGLIADVINLLNKAGYYVLNPVIKLEELELLELLKEIIKEKIKGCTNIVHLSELEDE